MIWPKPARAVDEAVLARARARRCLACGRLGADPAHVKSRGSGGGDFDWNVIPLCRVHHTEQHQIGFSTFARKYFGVRSELTKLGWYEDERGKLYHPSQDKI